MEGKLPNWTKEIDFQKVQEAQRVPEKFTPRRNTPRHIIITLPKVKDKERILGIIVPRINLIGYNTATAQSLGENLKSSKRRDSYLQRSAHKPIS